MSDVHGKKREKTTEEALQAKKLKEAVKIKEYNELIEKCRNKFENKEYTDETFKLTTEILQWNPEFYTVWNYRRIILVDLVKDEEEKQKAYTKELMFFLQLIKVNPKSYWLWNHRMWCLQHMPNPDWKAELGLVEKMLSMDARNFHGWDYRRFVVGHLQKNAEDKAESDKILQAEYDFTTKKINQSFSNYSAWHRRSKLLPDIVESMTIEERNTVATNELDLVKNAIYTDPEDQSAWLYYWWLLGKAPEEVSVLGAYRVENSRWVIIGFNDRVKWTALPQFEGTSCQLYPVDSKEGESASLWAILPDEDVLPESLMINSSIVLPSCSRMLVPQDKVWKIQIKSIVRGSSKGIQLLEEKIKDKKINAWKDMGAKFYKDPTLQDQTAWFNLDKIQLLKDEIESIKELLEVEPESAWALQTLAHFLDQYELRSSPIDSTSLFDEIIEILDQLIKLDSDRKFRYEDQKKHFLFKKLTQSLLSNRKEYNQNIPKDYLNLEQLKTVPLVSVLLLVPKLIVSSKELETKLKETLPFLEDCKLV